MDKMGIWFIHDDEKGFLQIICEAKEFSVDNEQENL
jgi:hypothetical protein